MDNFLNNLYNLVLDATKTGSIIEVLRLLSEEDYILGASVFLISKESDNKNNLKKLFEAVGEPIEAPEKNIITDNTIYEFLPSLDKSEGILGVKINRDLTLNELSNIKAAAIALGVCLTRVTVSGTLNTINNRVGLLNELSRLSASNATQDRIFKVLAKDSAFRTKAQGSIAVQYSKEDRTLKICGIFGLPVNYMGQTINIDNSQVLRSLEMASIISLPDLKNSHDSYLSQLGVLGFNAANITPLILMDDMFGALILLYKNYPNFDENTNLILGDISQGSSLALAGCMQREQLSKYTSKLEDLVEERTKELAIQTARADEASLAKSQFVANMSHELRTPLTSIVGFSSLLSEGLLGELNSQQEDAIKSVVKATEYLKDLINDVLDMARVESGKEEASPKKIKLKEVISQTTKLLQQTAKSKNIDLRSEISEELADSAIFVDARHIRQIIINLISNAIKYTHTGGWVKINAEVLSDKMKISITDNGVGISNQDKKKIFQAFDRLEDDYSKEQIGTGLGLNLTKRLVELNCGVIDFESTAGEGTVFSIYIPLFTELNEEISARKLISNKEEQSICLLNDLNILILDDDLPTLELIGTLVESLGGSCFKCSNIKSAMETSKNNSVDAYLVDIALRGESGIDFIKTLKKTNITVPIIVVSGCVFGTHEQESLKEGADAFLSKPFSSGELSSLIRSKSIEKAMRS